MAHQAVLYFIRKFGAKEELADRVRSRVLMLLKRWQDDNARDFVHLLHLCSQLGFQMVKRSDKASDLEKSDSDESDSEEGA